MGEVSGRRWVHLGSCYGLPGARGVCLRRSLLMEQRVNVRVFFSITFPVPRSPDKPKNTSHGVTSH